MSRRIFTTKTASSRVRSGAMAASANRASLCKMPSAAPPAELAARAEVSDTARRSAELVARGGVLVLTGAGVSTASGIPDYRDERGAWKRAQPMQFREFTGSDAARRRYWARSFLGFGVLGRAQPNLAHRVLAAWLARDFVSTLVTQNVDGLHQAAGSERVIDLHGRIDRVVCLACRRVSARSALQHELAELNPDWAARPAVIAPDGDADPGHTDYTNFRVPACACGGTLKPDVVFFGENVPKERVAQAMAALEDARCLLVVGSSLMVFSGYRFARAAERRGLPIVVVNRGHTRADAIAALKLDSDAGQALSAMAECL
jgi:NAD-dependent SIR2 family protein deacetylase